MVGFRRAEERAKGNHRQAEPGVNAGLANLKIKTRLAELGGTALAGSPADLSTLIADETEKWAKVIKFAGIKAD